VSYPSHIEAYMNCLLIYHSSVDKIEKILACLKTQLTVADCKPLEHLAVDLLVVN